MINNLILLATLIPLFSFCYSYLSFDFVEASFIDNIDIAIATRVEDIKYNSDNKHLYLSLAIGDVDDNSVYVVDTLSNKIINRITGVGKNPAGIDYNPDNKLIYVTNRNDNSVSVINSSSNEVIKNITGVGNNPKDIIYNPENHLMYVTNLEDNSVSVINSSSNEVIKNITGVGNLPFSIVYNPDNNLIYVTNFDEGSISVINSSSNEVIKNITDIGNRPSAITYNPKDRNIYVAGENFMSAINSSNTITKRIEYANSNFGILGSNLLYNPFNNNMYISAPTNGLILIFNSINNNPSYIPMNQAGPMEYNPDNNLVYIANGHGIAIFNSTSMKSTINEIINSHGYWDLAYNPEGDLIYATTPDNMISVINSSSNKISSQDKIAVYNDYPTIDIHDRESSFAGITYRPESNLTGITYRLDNHSLYIISPNKLNELTHKTSIFVVKPDGELVKQIPISIKDEVTDIKYNSDNNTCIYP